MGHGVGRKFLATPQNNYLQQKIPENRSFRGFLELLGGFEPPTSSLPTDWEPSSRCVPTLSGYFCSKRMRSPVLLCPLLPPARFPVWVSMWVRHYWSYSLVDANVCCSYHLFYPEDGRLEISNNCTEHSIKPIVMARKNWLLANTPAGA